jgi:hypothetical protein
MIVVPSNTGTDNRLFRLYLHDRISALCYIWTRQYPLDWSFRTLGGRFALDIIALGGLFATRPLPDILVLNPRHSSSYLSRV